MNNLDRWNKAKFTRSTQIEAMAAKIKANRARYETVSAKTGVPWDVIAVIHSRESSCNFASVLHNGEHIVGTGRKTKLVPPNRGPFATWEDAAVDALMNCHPYAGKNKDWSLGNTLDLLEAYNGLGYRKRGLPSPYLWAGTDQYVKGKYIADGKFDPNAVDQQIGAAAVLLCLRGKDNVQNVQNVQQPSAQSGTPKSAPTVNVAPKASAPVAAGAAAAVVAAGGLAAYWHEFTTWLAGWF